MRARRTLLIFTQGYPPDPMSVGQHLSDVAAEMVRRGWRVVVLTARRGYDDPRLVYPARERRGGVEVVRLPASSFGKRSLGRRAAAAALFAGQCALGGLLWRDLAGILVATVPPLIGAAALAARRLRGVPLACWVMDLNPEQLIALGKLSAGAAAARAIDGLNGEILRAASLVVALDRFMAQRLSRKAPLGVRLEVIPPWPHEQALEDVAHEANPFRAEHGLAGKRVVMYSGNHSPSNPLTTLLEATRAFRDDPELVFLFVGGGQGKREVEAFVRDTQAPNVRSLPYEPLSRLRYSLSAADVHLVAMGDPFVGILHPCKVYGAMAVGRPVLFLGPRPSHVSELLEAHGFGWRVAHGDVLGAVRTLSEIREAPAHLLRAMGARARAALEAGLGQEVLVTRFCDRLEAALG